MYSSATKDPPPGGVQGAQPKRAICLSAIRLSTGQMLGEQGALMQRSLSLGSKNVHLRLEALAEVQIVSTDFKPA